jgi:hypothetical protein
MYVNNKSSLFQLGKFCIPKICDLFGVRKFYSNLSEGMQHDQKEYRVILKEKKKETVACDHCKQQKRKCSMY